MLFEVSDYASSYAMHIKGSSGLGIKGFLKESRQIMIGIAS